MLAFFSSFLKKESIDCYAAIPLSDCRVRKPYLLERAGIEDGTVIIMAVPYFSSVCNSPDRNLSAYAVSRDYHLFFQQLFERLLAELRERYPQNKFAAFADHSPIDEVNAAAKAWLGMIGKNQLLITPRYSSYVFLGEVITDAVLPCKSLPITSCENCGKCLLECPMQECGVCLSALTQKKGTLSEEEAVCVVKHGSLWGCDLCQEACPHTQKAIREHTIESPIPFFREQHLARLSTTLLEEMPDDVFAERAYAWRGKHTVLRNAELMEAFEKGATKC